MDLFSLAVFTPKFKKDYSVHCSVWLYVLRFNSVTASNFKRRFIERPGDLTEKTGLCIELYFDGSIFSLLPFENGICQGLCKLYDYNGILDCEATCRDGFLRLNRAYGGDPKYNSPMENFV